MSELVIAQQKFARMLGELLVYIYEQGYAVTGGELWRTPEQAEWNAAKGIGSKNSLHLDRLAIDLNFWSGDRLIQPPDSIVTYWESIGGTWGGRFKDAKGNPKPDAPHFSLAYGGRK